MLLEFSRLFNAPFLNPHLVVLVPFYSTLIPFALMCFFSREAHIQVSLLYFASVLLIYMQSGVATLQLHMMAYIMTFLAVYTGIVIGMANYYIDNSGVSFAYGRILDPLILWGQEITFILTLALLGVTFLLLERFIKLYATTLVERSREIETLELEKEELKNEIRRFKEGEENLDVDAPIQKVVSILQSIAAGTK